MSGGIEEDRGVFSVYFVSEMAQVELRSGRVEAPAQHHARLRLRIGPGGYCTPRHRAHFEPFLAECNGIL